MTSLRCQASLTPALLLAATAITAIPMTAHAAGAADAAAAAPADANGQPALDQICRFPLRIDPVGA